MKRYKKTYDNKHKVTRILLTDYLALKAMSLAAGVSMSEALHRLIEHQAQLPLMSRTQPTPAIVSQPMPAFRVAPIPEPAFRSAPVTAMATNGSKGAAFRIKPKGARND